MDLPKSRSAPIDSSIAPARTKLLGIGTAVPSYAVERPKIVRFLSNVAKAQPEAWSNFENYVRRIAEGSGIAQRHSVLSDHLAEEPEDFRFYPKNWALEPFPSTADRMRMYQASCVELAAEAAQGALTQAGISPSSVTHLIVTTCTGFFAPGPDIELIDRLSLRPDVQRTIIGFMGCYAGINALRQADHIARAEPSAVVLQVSVELCTLHYQRSPTIKALVANMLFGDGAAAAVYSAKDGEGPALGVVTGTRAFVQKDSRDKMRWDIGDHGFLMDLDGSVPEAIFEAAPPFVEAMLDRLATRREEVVGWAIHPGGRKILEFSERALKLEGGRGVRSAFEVLERYGNMSSATILFVLERELAALTQPGKVAMLAFGPGLTIEGALLQVDAPLR